MMPFTQRLLVLIGIIGLAITFWQGPSLSTWLIRENYRWKEYKDANSAISQTFSSDQRILSQSDNSIKRRVVAVADLHGDLEHAHNVLRMAGLIDNEKDWIGGHDILVSTGDIVDRGDDTIELYKMFQRLRQQANDQGGDIFNCIGNHEMMNALMDWRYVTKGDLNSFGGAKERRRIMSIDGWIGKDWKANYSISHTIPLLPSSKIPSAVAKSYKIPHANFVHGGIHPNWAGKGLRHINEVGHSLLIKALSNPKPGGWLPGDTNEEEQAFYGAEGPLWYRGFATDKEEEVCKEADMTRKDLGSFNSNVRHLVMGHTPHLSGFVIRCSGSVLLIDTGISRAYGGEQSALIFETTLRSSSNQKGSGWEEEGRIIALYRGRLPKVIDSRIRQIDVD